MQLNAKCTAQNTVSHCKFRVKVSRDRGPPSQNRLPLLPPNNSFRPDGIISRSIEVSTIDPNSFKISEYDLPESNLEHSAPTVTANRKLSALKIQTWKVIEVEAWTVKASVKNSKRGSRLNNDCSDAVRDVGRRREVLREADERKVQKGCRGGFPLSMRKMADSTDREAASCSRLLRKS
ncbi:unnamed protein product [Lasius platythorax]|uniref:Uncharacterized protein n=1 Tax=Lasius platythorax TaxID=488582 RepID=A0AAV2NA77_9HYME